MNVGKLGVWYFFDGLPAPAAAEAAKRIETLGYGTLWIPETVGRHPLVHASWLLANTSTLNLRSIRSTKPDCCSACGRSCL